MSASRARNIMIAAIAISLILHLILAGYLRWPFAPPSDRTEVVKVRRMTIARIVPRTPPPPTPAPTSRASAAPKVKVAPPKTSSHTVKGPSLARVPSPGSGTAAPSHATPVPTAPPSAPQAQPCLDHDIAPAVSESAAPVDIPPDVRASKASGTAQIDVQIDADGHVVRTTIAQSSGNAGLDAVALEMARGATYTPALVKCKAVVAAYRYSVKFVAF